jgi:hypothetical protein
MKSKMADFIARNYQTNSLFIEFDVSNKPKEENFIYPKRITFHSTGQELVFREERKNNFTGGNLWYIYEHDKPKNCKGDFFDNKVFCDCRFDDGRLIGSCRWMCEVPFTKKALTDLLRGFCDVSFQYE